VQNIPRIAEDSGEESFIFLGTHHENLELWSGMPLYDKVNVALFSPLCYVVKLIGSFHIR